MQKLTLALAGEKVKWQKELETQDEKMKNMGATALEAMNKMLKMAEIRKSKNEILNEMHQE